LNKTLKNFIEITDEAKLALSKNKIQPDSMLIDDDNLDYTVLTQPSKAEKLANFKLYEIKNN